MVLMFSVLEMLRSILAKIYFWSFPNEFIFYQKDKFGGNETNIFTSKIIISEFFFVWFQISHVLEGGIFFQYKYIFVKNTTNNPRQSIIFNNAISEKCARKRGRKKLIQQLMFSNIS